VSDALKDLAANGVSIWLDDLSRELLESSELGRLIKERGVVGVTTNPTIFANALSKGDRYEDQVKALAARGAILERCFTTPETRQNTGSYSTKDKGR